LTASEQLERVRDSGGVIRTLRLLRGHRLLAAGVVFVCVAIAVVHHERAPKSYVATASVAFESGTLSDSALSVTPSPSSEPQREANTEVLIADSPEVASAVAKQLKTPATASELLGQVTVETAPNADILDIVAKTGRPAYSASLANAFAQQYIAFRTKSELSSVESTQTQLQHQLAALPAGSPERATLEQSLQRIASARAVAGGGATIIGLATPPDRPSGSGVSTAVAIGLLIGVAVAFSLLFLLDSIDRRVKTVEELEREYRLPALTVVSQTAFRSRLAKDRGDELEPYRILRSALDFAAVSRQLNCLMVTSAISGEGKTTVAVDLSHAIAFTGRRVVLIELDLRRPSFGSQFELDSRSGLTTALTGGAPVTELLVEPFAELPNFSVLPAGLLPHNPSELLGSGAIAPLISDLRGEDGIVIVDAPPLNPVADAQVLLGNPAIDAVLVVARLDKTTREETRRARAILDHHGIDPVGLVVTGLRDASRYGYEAYASNESEQAADLDVLAYSGGSPLRQQST
jgi:capsular exopolysaccharide synthesis family protein